MAYSTSNPPVLLAQGISSTRKLWLYASIDAATLVRVAGYITNAASLGMKAGDLVWQIDTDASPIAAQLMTVNSINATTGAADLTDGTAVTATNTD
jgi:hypothetical protein